jgi:hypothetical protein
MAGAMAVALWLLAAVASAQTPLAPPADANPKDAKEYSELQAKLAQQNGSKQAETLAKLAQLDYGFAADGFAHGQSDNGLLHLRQATHWADQAMAVMRSEAADGTTKGMKNVEIAFQKIAFGLSGLAQQVHLRERSQVQAVNSHFVQLRSQLLDFMFAPKKK